MSGKINELIDLFIGEIDVTARPWNERRIETKASWTDRLGLIERLFDALKDEFAG